MLFSSLISEIIYYAAVVSSAYFIGWWYFRAKRNDFLNVIEEVNVTIICQFDNHLKLINQNNHWWSLTHKLGISHEARANQFREFLNYLAAYDTHGAAELADAITSVISGNKKSVVTKVSLPLDDRICIFRARVTRSDNQSNRYVIFLADFTEEAIREQKLRSANRQAETMAKVLEANQQSLELAVQGAKIGLWHWDIDSGYFELSRGWFKMLGHPEYGYDCELTKFSNLIHPDDKNPFLIQDDEHPELENFNHQFRLLKDDGSVTWVEVKGSINRRSKDSKPLGISGVLIDINDRKISELRDSAFRKIIDESINEVYILDAKDFKFIEVNRGARKNLGYEMSELRKMTPADISKRTMEEVHETIETVLHQGSDRIEIETAHRRKDGSTYPLFLTAQRTEYLGREVLLATGIDITKRHDLERQLRQSQKLESIGQLAAGVAHEINTPLQSVSFNIQFLSETTHSVLDLLQSVEEKIEHAVSLDDLLAAKEDLNYLLKDKDIASNCEEIPEAIDESSQALNRVLEILKAMKEYSHPGDDVNDSHDINHAIQTSVTVTKNRWRQHASLELQLDESIPHAACNIGTLNQVLVNIIVNAVDAIEDRFGEESLYQGKLGIKSYQNKSDIMIEIADNGCGIPKHILQRIYDPFFTTKDVGKGTGQGLSYCHNAIVTQHRGKLEVETTEGEGTKFIITIPILQRARVVNCESLEPPRSTDSFNSLEMATYSF